VEHVTDAVLNLHRDHHPRPRVMSVRDTCRHHTPRRPIARASKRYPRWWRAPRLSLTSERTSSPRTSCAQRSPLTQVAGYLGTFASPQLLCRRTARRPCFTRTNRQDRPVKVTDRREFGPRIPARHTIDARSILGFTRSATRTSWGVGAATVSVCYEDVVDDADTVRELNGAQPA
jgi:hypothetical protein